MDTKQVILELRNQKGMSQAELAEKVFVSRQAVSRWENGETVPNTETLKLLSKVFDVSINTLLGSPRKLICQCCGMPLEDDDIIGHNHDGSFNEEYCKWCYADGTYTYNDMDDLIEVCVKNMVSENFTEAQARSYMKELLPYFGFCNAIIPRIRPAAATRNVSHFPPAQHASRMATIPRIMEAIPSPFAPSSIFCGVPP